MLTAEVREAGTVSAGEAARAAVQTVARIYQDQLLHSDEHAQAFLQTVRESLDDPNSPVFNKFINCR